MVLLSLSGVGRGGIEVGLTGGGVRGAGEIVASIKIFFFPSRSSSIFVVLTSALGRPEYGNGRTMLGLFSLNPRRGMESGHSVCFVGKNAGGPGIWKKEIR